MGADMTGSFGGGPEGGDPGGRQYPMRPVGARQYPMRPVDPRQYPMRPVDPRQYPMRPAAQQYPMRPYGRQYPMRPADSHDDAGADYLDTEEWAADIAELFCGYSAVIRLGARLVFDVDDLPVPVTSLQDAPVYLPPSVLPDPNEHKADAAIRTVQLNAVTEAVSKAVRTSNTTLVPRRLRPHAHELMVQVAMRNRLGRTVGRHPDVAWSLKEDIAYALAIGADQGFLHGHGGPGPVGITDKKKLQFNSDRASLATVRKMVGKVRRTKNPRFVNAGWVLHPRALEALSEDLAAARPSAAGQALTHDGADGGTLLGYPFVLSAAAAEDQDEDAATRIYFSSDWGEAWIAAAHPLVTIEVSRDVHFDRDETVVRAITQHDFKLRTAPYFTYTKPITR